MIHFVCFSRHNRKHLIYAERDKDIVVYIDDTTKLLRTASILYAYAFVKYDDDSSTGKRWLTDGISDYALRLLGFSKTSSLNAHG